MLYFTNNYKEMESNTSNFEEDWFFLFFLFETFQLTLFDLQLWSISLFTSWFSTFVESGTTTNTNVMKIKEHLRYFIAYISVYIISMENPDNRQ